MRGRTGYDADDAGEPAAPWPPDRERLWEILQAVPAGITVLGSDGALLFANVAAARLAGFSTAASMVAAGAEEARARLEIRDEAGEPVPADRLPCHLALTGQQPAPLAIRLHDHRTGERRRARLSAASIPDESSGGWLAITAINEVGAARRGAGDPVRTGSPDLDEERAAAEVNRAAELSAIIGAMGEGIVVFAASGTAVLANPAAEDLFPGIATWTYAELLGRLEDGPAEGPPLGAVGGPVELRTSERTERWIEVSADPIAPGGAAPGETIIVLRDVTATRQREAVRDMFVGMLSHELRTPVTTIYAGAKVLARHRDALTGPWLEIFDDMQAEAERLHRLVEDVIALTRFEEGGVDIGSEPVLLQRVLPSVVRSEHGRWPGVEVRLDVTADLPPVSADLTYVEQVVRNLLSNAAKYAGPRATIDIRADAARDGWVVVRILDDGPGFTADEADRLFDLFYRSPAAAARASGAGIGLFVCARLIAAMNGRIWGAPRASGGAEFGFALRSMAVD